MSADSIYDQPAYGLPEAAQYLRLPYSRVRSWTAGDGLVQPTSSAALSFNNLLELHVLGALRNVHGFSLQAIRRALQQLRKTFESDHPLVEAAFATDGIDLFVQNASEIINLSRGGQLALKDVISLYLQRIDRDASGRANRLYPFVAGDSRHEPKSISISPEVSFGRSVLAGTGVATAVVAGRFAARDSVADLAAEYGVAPDVIEDAIRWEAPQSKAA